MKRAKLHAPPQPPKVRNPVARSPLLGKGGAHGKTNAAKRRQANIALAKLRATRIPTSDPTTLSRSDLESGRMRELYIEARRRRGMGAHRRAAVRVADGDARRKPKGAGWWVFAYGSLLWNPLFPFAETRPATLRGLHRRFCLWSLASRGTPDKPGLVLALDRGGACRASRTGCRRRSRSTSCICCGGARWSSAPIGRAGCGVRSGERELVALTFVVRRAPAVRGQAVARRAGARDRRRRGAFGSSLDYLERTRVALVTHGIVDPYLERLAAKGGGAARLARDARHLTHVTRWPCCGRRRR